MMDLDQKLAQRLTKLRKARGLSLEDLTGQTGISRATLSRIERGETSPTAVVLGKLAGEFGLTMAALFGAETGSRERLFLNDRQPTWTDPDTGFQRRVLTPGSGDYRGSVIEGVLPAGQTISYSAPPVPGLEHHLAMLEGALVATIGHDRFDLSPGDALRFRLDAPNSYHAPGPRAARYFLTVITP